jgi:glucose-6-phosphate isomerase
MELDPNVTTGDYLCGFLLGTREALYEKGRDTITVTLPTVNSKMVGALIALYERAVGFYATLINVNAYHQPGVEAGKKAAAATLALQQKLLEGLKDANGAIALTDLAAKVGETDRIETVYKILRHLHANGRLKFEGSLSQPEGLKVSRL